MVCVDSRYSRYNLRQPLLCVKSMLFDKTAEYDQLSSCSSPLFQTSHKESPLPLTVFLCYPLSMFTAVQRCSFLFPEKLLSFFPITSYKETIFLLSLSCVIVRKVPRCVEASFTVLRAGPADRDHPATITFFSAQTTDCLQEDCAACLRQWVTFSVSFQRKVDDWI